MSEITSIYPRVCELCKQKIGTRINEDFHGVGNCIPSSITFTQAEVDQLVSVAAALNMAHRCCHEGTRTCDKSDIACHLTDSAAIRDIPHDSTSLNRLPAEARLEEAKWWHGYYWQGTHHEHTSDASCLRLAAAQKVVEDLK